MYRLTNAGNSGLYLLNLSSFEVTHLYLSISVLCFTLLFLNFSTAKITRYSADYDFT